MLATNKSKRQSAGRIALLIADGDMGWCAANYLAGQFDDVHILIEQPEAKSAIFKRRARLLGWNVALGQAACGVATRLLARYSRGQIDAICRDSGLARTPPPAHAVLSIGSVNSPTARVTLAAIKPDVVAVYGTRIIRRETLTAVAAPFINYHAGINPKYRGQHPGYWALVNGDAARAGVTIHLIDEGVDTGDVLYQAPVAFAPGDNITTYQWRQMGIGLPLLADAIEDALAKQLRPLRVELPSAQYFPPTIWGYVWNGATRGVW